MVVKENRKMLKIDKHLPQIVLPAKTRAMFINWWNTDIRFEQTLPKVFDSGYVLMEYNYLDREQEILEKHKDSIKYVAKHFHTTYRQAEYMIKDLIFCFSKVTIYFKFVADNALNTEIYGRDDKLISTMDFAVGQSEPEPEIETDDIISIVFGETLPNMLDNNDDYAITGVAEIAKTWLSQLVTAIWYIATTKSTKYIYENKTPVIVSRKKNVVKVSDTKTINTPIYDLNKVRIVKVEHLQTRKKGWTYSHAFQVHGHYRHYKNGKVIFIEPYVKGKNKEFKAQQIILDPKQV